MRVPLLLTLLLVMGNVHGQSVDKSDTLSPEDLNISKWVFKQKTDTVTVAVMRVEHMVAGTMVEQYEEVTYRPDHENLGSLLVFNSETPVRIQLPTSNFISPKVDKRWSSLGDVTRKLKGIDGVERPAEGVEIRFEHEIICVLLYPAPLAIFKGKLKDIPDPEDGKTSAFQWRHEMIEDRFIVRKTGEGKDMKVEVIERAKE